MIQTGTGSILGLLLFWFSTGTTDPRSILSDFSCVLPFICIWAGWVWFAHPPSSVRRCTAQSQWLSPIRISQNILVLDDFPELENVSIEYMVFFRRTKVNIYVYKSWQYNCTIFFIMYVLVIFSIRMGVSASGLFSTHVVSASGYFLHVSCLLVVVFCMCCVC